MHESHKLQIISYMKFVGPLTPWTAIEKFGCTKLATRISELIDQGWKINKDWHRTENSKGYKVRVRKYSLSKG